jgi:hypothetical protein
LAGVVVHAYNPSIQEAEAGGSNVQVSLGYCETLFPKQQQQKKTKKLGYCEFSEEKFLLLYTSETPENITLYVCIDVCVCVYL